MLKGIYNHNTSKMGYEYNELMSAAKRMNIKLVEPWTIKKDTYDQYDFTLNRSYLANNLKYQTHQQFNRMIDGIFWKNKENQLKYLETYCSKPLTLYGKQTFNSCKEYLGFPFIAKRSISSQGKGVFLIKSDDDFNRATDCDIYQEVIWESMGQDLRVWVLGGHIIGVMNRQNENSFKANIHQGGEGHIYNVDSTIELCARSIYKQTGLTMMGIDLLFGNGEYYFCELNVNPGFKGFDDCFNIKTGELILEYVRNQVNV